MDRPHRWKQDYPGDYCLDCGEPNPLEREDALINCTCDYGCEKCCYTGSVLNPNLKVSPCPGSKTDAPVQLPVSSV